MGARGAHGCSLGAECAGAPDAIGCCGRRWGRGADCPRDRLRGDGLVDMYPWVERSRSESVAGVDFAVGMHRLFSGIRDALDFHVLLRGAGVHAVGHPDALDCFEPGCAVWWSAGCKGDAVSSGRGRVDDDLLRADDSGGDFVMPSALAGLPTPLHE